VNEGQIWIKRVVAEMGGKDAIVVADDADLDEAATGIVQSAFGYQGQKCSACSRAIIDAKVYEPILDKIVERTAKLKLATSTDPGCESQRLSLTKRHSKQSTATSRRERVKVDAF
jgi:1-pyrroline-5-carboxylate dehydrogenase